jgi:myo-inositol 2-dehydrogenase/D-chiro-inositol 1-dehydrogenase
MSQSNSDSDSSRRGFLKASSAAVVGAATLAVPRGVHAQGTDILTVGLVGCGGRGSGAALNAMRANQNNRLVAMADVFPDSLDLSKRLLASELSEEASHQLQVNDDHLFTGFDAYRNMMESNVDVVILTTPPHFRPAQLRAAIEAGKHVFCEKPVAVDPVGIRSVLETVELARKKNLSIVSGLCWRYDHGVRATMEQIQDGAIGDIVGIQENYLTGTLWQKPRKPEWTEMEYQMRNWLYFTWLSGDHIVEQHIHSLDKSLWLMNDVPPARCYGLGGRQMRTDERWGNIFDHFAVCYEWDNGVKTFAYTRQMKGCSNETEDYVLGSKGRARVLKHRIEGANTWRYDGDKPSMYDVEHVEMFEGIRKGEPINNGEYMAYSTMMAIMGREACYTGSTITWDAAMNSPQDLSPKTYEWGDIEVPEVAKPGLTKFA